MTDLVLKGGRVVDPGSGLDTVADVAIDAGRIQALAPRLHGHHELDVSGLVVSPGFVDLHSHAQDLAGHRLQAMDGVTTSLELEAGCSPVGASYAAVAAEGRPLNYGFSASWAQARMIVLAGAAEGGGVQEILKHLGRTAWQAPASRRETAAILERLRADLAEGALGIGVLVGYAPTLDLTEYLDVARLAAEHAVPTFTHARSLIEFDPTCTVDGATEIVRAADETGAHMHCCHLSGTSRHHVDRVLAQLDRARSGGARITTESYPYGAASTAIGAAFLHPDSLARQGLLPSMLAHVPLGRRVHDREDLVRLRGEDPGALAIIHWLDDNDPADQRHLLTALTYADSAIASDAMPLTWDRPGRDASRWPLVPGAAAHPRTAGTFARSIRLLHREEGRTLSEVIARCSWYPAQVLAEAVPAMRHKGHLGVGADADIVVFDPLTLTDRATYELGVRPSTGVEHLLVGGEAVIRNGTLIASARPGRAVRR